MQFNPKTITNRMLLASYYAKVAKDRLALKPMPETRARRLELRSSSNLLQMSMDLDLRGSL